MGHLYQRAQRVGRVDVKQRQTDRVADFLEMGPAKCALLATIAGGELRYCTGCKDTGSGVRQVVLLGARQVPVW